MNLDAHVNYVTNENYQRGGTSKQGIEDPYLQPFITQEPLPSFIEEEIGVSKEKGKEKVDSTGVNGNDDKVKDPKGNDEKGKGNGKEPLKVTRPMPYLNALRKDKLAAQYKRFQDMMKNVSVNLPIIDVLKGMPNYGRFIKELIFQRERLGLGPLKPTRIRIRLANHSFNTANGISEDILVSIDTLVYPIDFVIMVMKEDLPVPLILGRPFLADTIILVQRNQLNIGVGEEHVTINIREAMKQSSNTDDECYALDHIDFCVDNDLEKLLGVDTTGFNQICDNDIVDLETDIRELMYVNIDESEIECDTTREEPFETILNEDRFCIKSSSEEQPTLELKELPEHLEYAYLKEANQLSMIISSRLT
ncbi:uncharacterized protein [Rutidosis leptorrhynchoides]|uniref:uncharacterized protein n=1 Tax=Rutidosis leptorrhynchoides TaxID=125765 RepID=UPI003A996F3E